MRILKWGFAVFFSLAIIGLLIVLPWMMSFAVTVPNNGTPKDQGLAYETVRLAPTDYAIDISAWWIPAPAPKATILFVHGGNGNKTDPNFGSLPFYKALHDKGFNVLTLDLRNHGASGRSSSGRLTFGREEKFDAIAGVEWVRKRQPNLPLFAVGISMGGATLIHMTAGDTKVDGLILIDPVLDNRDVIVRSLSAILGWPKSLVAPTAWVADTVFIDSHGLADPADIAATLRTPMLIVADDYDPVARVEHARSVANTNPMVRLIEIPKSASDGATTEQGRWAGHVTAFLRQPHRVISAIDDFVSRQN